MATPVPPAPVTARRRGVSTGAVLLGAAIVGTLAGVVLAEFRVGREPETFDEDDALDDVRADQVLPLGEPAPAPDLMVPDFESLDGIAPYPGASPRKLTGKTSVQGMPMKVSWFMTPDKPDDVLGFYERAFAGEDRGVVSYRYNEGVGYVGFIDRSERSGAAAAKRAERAAARALTDAGDGDGDGDEYDELPMGVLHLVSVVGQQGGTLVFLSATTPSDFFDKPQKLPNGVLLPPSADQPQVMELAEFSLDRRTVFSRAPGMTLSDAKAFYLREMTTAGWFISDASPSAEQVSLVAKRGLATQVIQLSPDGPNTRILVTLDARPAPEMSR